MMLGLATIPFNAAPEADFNAPRFGVVPVWLNADWGYPQLGDYRGFEQDAYPAHLDSVESAGITWIRVNCAFRWDIIEETQGSPNFELEDSIVVWAQERGINVVPVVTHTPRWARQRDLDYEYDNYRRPPDPEHMDDWAAFCSTFVERYDGDGIGDISGLRYPLKYWQISNEPNGACSFYGTLREYLEYFRRGCEGMRSADPAIQIIGPTLAGKTSWKRPREAEEGDFAEMKVPARPGFWLDTILVEIGACIDIVCEQRYGEPRQIFRYLDATVKPVMDRHGKDRFWMTETGWNLDWVGITEKAQAAKYAEFCKYFLETDWFERVFFFSLTDFGHRYGDRYRWRFGMLDLPGLSPRAAYSTYRGFIKEHGVCLTVVPDPAHSRRPVTFTVTNNGNETITLRGVPWFTVTDSSGGVVFRDLAVQAAAAIAPDQSAEYVWHRIDSSGDQVEAGLYTVEVRYFQGDCMYLLSSEFEILSP